MGRRRRVFASLALSLRSLIRTPAYSIVAVLTLAVSVAAALMVFSLLNVLLLRPLPFPAPHELYMLRTVSPTPSGETDYIPAGPLELLRWREEPKLGRVGTFLPRAFAVGTTEAPERVDGGAVSAEWFEVLGPRPMIGRTFSAEEEAAGAAVAVISAALQDRLFAGSQSVGRMIRLDTQPYQVVGVMPRGFGAELDAGDVWVPLNLTAANMGPPGTRSMRVIARTPERIAGINTVLESIAGDLAVQSPGSHRGKSASAIPLQDWLNRDQRSAVFVIATAVALLLLLACVNVASLTVARAYARQGEVALRQAIGATNWRAASGLILEACVVALLGTAAGVLIAFVSLPLLLALNPNADGLITTAHFDGRVVLAAVLLGILSAALCAAVTGWLTTRVAPSSILAESGRRTSGGASARRVREALLVVQIAVAIVLLAGSAAALREISSLTRRDLGFETDGLVAVQFMLPRDRYPDTPARHAFASAVLARMRERPGVTAASVTTHWFEPFGSPQTDFIVDGRAMQDQGAYIAQLQRLELGYFSTTGIALLQGRDFNSFDRADTEPVVIINRRMAEAFWPGEDPLGQRIRRAGGTLPPMTVVGIVEDVLDSGPAQQAEPTMFLPMSQSSSPYVNFVVRTATTDGALFNALRQDVHAVDANLAIDRVAAVSTLMGDAIADQRFRTLLLTMFAGFGLLLAAVGIYGVTAYMVAQRRRELGIRLALGSRPIQLVALVCATTVRLLAIGALSGVAATALLAAVAQRRLPGLIVLDTAGLAVGFAVIALAALAATLIPAARASRMDPASVLAS